MDVFNADPFTAMSLTASVDKYPFVPQFLSGLPGLYEPAPVMTEEIFIETRLSGPALIQTSPRGSPLPDKAPDYRDARNFKTVRIGKKSRIKASELQNMRAFGSVTELQSLQMEIGRRNLKLRRDFELTKEYHLLNLVQGYTYDADGTLIYDWASQFSQTKQNFGALGLAAATVGTLRGQINVMKRTIKRQLAGLDHPGVRFYALCGDAFFDLFTQHPDVSRTYLNWAEAADLREKVGEEFSIFKFGGVYWVNYRGTDDNSTVAVATSGFKIFPVGAGIFQWAMSPGESFEFVNTPGKEIYEMIIVDSKRQMYADIEMYSYPLPVCVMPQALGYGTD
jgi:hypothetical protein